LIAYGLFWKCAEQFGVEVVALFLLWLVFFAFERRGVRSRPKQQSGLFSGHREALLRELLSTRVRTGGEERSTNPGNTFSFPIESCPGRKAWLRPRGSTVYTVGERGNQEET
jgi:hypothetical protein